MNETATSKHGTEIIRFPFEKTEDLYNWVEADEQNKTLFYIYVIRNMKLALDNGWSEVELFHLGDSGAYGRAELKDFPVLIQRMQTYFIEQEEYEMAGKCKSMLEVCAANN